MGKLRLSPSVSNKTTTLGAGAPPFGELFPPTVLDRTVAVARGIDLVLRHHDCPSSLISDCLTQVKRVLDTALDERIWVKRLKNLLARPLSLYLRNELPPDSDVVFQPHGAFRRWFRNRINAFNRKNTHLWYSWFQIKRCCLPSSEDFIKNTYEEHLESLTSPDPGDEFAIDAAFSNPTFFRLLEKLREGIDRYMIIVPSTLRATQSACFEARRDKGGQFKYLKSLAQELDEGEVILPHPSLGLDWLLVPHTSELFQMSFFPRTINRGSNFVLEKRQPYGSEEWSSLNDKIKRIDWTENLRCEIKGVVEPLKVRVISKGEALPYYSQRKLQRALHDQMRTMDCFRLIGRPFSPTDLLDLKVGTESSWQWFSVDYSAATDGLSWKFSSRILRFLLANRPSVELDAALRVLGPHDLYYPKWDEVKEKWTQAEMRGTQVNGQLMGSILSFPILCLANLATYLLTMSGVHHEGGLTDEEILRGVLVNGDDMVYAAPPALWPRHVKVSADLGLKMSIGKAYHHDRYANINSTSVTLPLGHDATPLEIPYLNVGLFFQEPVQKKETEDKKQARDERDKSRRALGYAKSHHEEEGVVACISKLLSGCLNNNKAIRILKEYLVRHGSVIREEALSFLNIDHRLVKHTRNLFTHSSVGGMGIIPPVGWRFKIKEVERVLAANLMSSLPCELSFGLPLSGFPLLELEERTDCPWQKPQILPDHPIFFVPHPQKKCSRSYLLSGFYPVVDNSEVALAPRRERAFCPYIPPSSWEQDLQLELFEDQFGPEAYGNLLEHIALGEVC